MLRNRPTMPGDRKIYFAGSIGGGRQDADIYCRLVEQLGNYGHVFTEHVGSADPEKDEVGMSDKQIHDRDLEWLKKSDVVVAECTQVSHGVGYELGRAVALNKQVLCLFRPDSGKKLSSMIRGAENGTTFICMDYKEAQLSDILQKYFQTR